MVTVALSDPLATAEGLWLSGYVSLILQTMAKTFKMLPVMLVAGRSRKPWGWTHRHAFFYHFFLPNKTLWNWYPIGMKGFLPFLQNKSLWKELPRFFLLSRHYEKNTRYFLLLLPYIFHTCYLFSSCTLLTAAIGYAMSDARPRDQWQIWSLVLWCPRGPTYLLVVVYLIAGTASICRGHKLICSFCWSDCGETPHQARLLHPWSSTLLCWTGELVPSKLWMFISPEFKWIFAPSSFFRRLRLAMKTGISDEWQVDQLWYKAMHRCICDQTVPLVVRGPGSAQCLQVGTIIMNRYLYNQSHCHCYPSQNIVKHHLPSPSIVQHH